MRKKTSEMTIAELRARAAEIRTEVNTEGADLNALDAEAEVFQRERHAGQRQLAIDRFRLCPRGVIKRLGDGVDVWPRRLGAHDRCVDQLLRRQLSLMHQLGKPGRILFPKHTLDRHCHPHFGPPPFWAAPFCAKG